MTKADFDITFCTGGVPNENGECIECKVKGQCRRNWTQEHNEEARKLGLLEHKVYILVDPNMLTDQGCVNFLEK